MSGDIEAAGALATAGLAARELDKGGAGHGLAGADCRNCGTRLTGKYCHVCGQPGHVERKLSHAFEEALHGILHFDSKAWRTIPLLMFRPGTLTYNYIHGMRVRYITPVALFLFTVFLMFFAFALIGEVRLGGGDGRPTAALEAEIAGARGEMAQAQKELAEAEAKLAALNAKPEAAAPGEIGGQTGVVAGLRGTITGAEASLRSAEAELKRRQGETAKLRAALDQLDKNEATAKVANDTEALQEIAISRAIIKRALSNPNGPPSSVRVAVAADGDVNVSVGAADSDGMNTIFEEIKSAAQSGQLKVNTGNEVWNEKIRHKLENPELAWYKIQNTAYKFSFLLVPISLPFLWLMFFWKRGVTLYDHTVFALYSLSFMSLLFVLLVLASRAPAAMLGGVMAVGGTVFSVGAPLHIFFHLKGTYALGWFSAFWRTCAMLVFAACAIAIFVGIIFLLGLLG